jgi:hypothetical protein
MMASNCRCCQCNGKKCLTSHPGHSHIADSIAQAMFGIDVKILDAEIEEIIFRTTTTTQVDEPNTQSDEDSKKKDSPIS